MARFTLGLVTPEAAEQIGKPTGPPRTATVDAEGARRYAHAVGDDNPIWFDEAAAHAAGYRAIPVHPTYVQYALVEGRPLTEIGTDGLFRGGARLPLNVHRVMFGGEEWDFVDTVHVGDTITAVSRVADLDEKDGSKGPFVRITRETTFTNQHGDVVARTRQIGIAR